MAMITIERGQTRIRVPKSIFDSYYKGLGYRKAIDRYNSNVEWDGSTKNGNGDENENKNINVDTIPISEMSAAQLKEYAVKHNIDISSARKPSDARRIIQKHIQGEKM